MVVKLLYNAEVVDTRHFVYDKSPYNFMLRRGNLKGMQILKNHLGGQRIPGWNGKRDKSIELCYKFRKPPHSKGWGK